MKKLWALLLCVCLTVGMLPNGLVVSAANETLTVDQGQQGECPVCNATVTWTVSGDGCTLSDNKITGAVSGSITTVKTTHNGKTYTCIVRVS